MRGEEIFDAAKKFVDEAYPDDTKQMRSKCINSFIEGAIYATNNEWITLSEYTLETLVNIPGFHYPIMLYNEDTKASLFADNEEMIKAALVNGAFSYTHALPTEYPV
jgi:hypothetical protein